MSNMFVDEQLGSDANAGTIESPFASVYHAWAVHTLGDTIYVLPPIEDKSEFVTGRKTFSPMKEENAKT